MNQQDRRLDLVRKHEWRNLYVQIGSLPEGPPLVLKSKRSERAVICSAARNAGAKQIRVRQQVCGHERAVTVSAHSYTIRIDHAHLGGLINGGFRARGDL